MRLGVPIRTCAWLPKRLPAAHAAAAAGPTDLDPAGRRSALLWRAWGGRGSGRIELRPAARGVCGRGCLAIGRCTRGRICGPCRRAADEDPSVPKWSATWAQTQMQADSACQHGSRPGQQSSHRHVLLTCAAHPAQPASARCTLEWPGKTQWPHRSAAARRPQTPPNRLPAHAPALRPRPEPPAGLPPARAMRPASLGWPGQSGCWRRPGARAAAQPAGARRVLSWHCMKPIKKNTCEHWRRQPKKRPAGGAAQQDL